MALSHVLEYVILVLAFVNISPADDAKRILVGDHPVEHTLEEEVQSLKQKVFELNTKLAQLETVFTNMNASKIAQLTVRVDELFGKDSTLEAAVSSLQTQMTSVVGPTSEGGSTYVIWGNKDCPGNGTSLVYEGFSGGSDYNYVGGPGDFLCMPPDPLYETNVSTEGSVYVNGVQYGSTFYNSVEYNDAMPCALCQTNRSSVIMLPGRNRCHEGWTLEYYGWLAAGGYNQASSQYICLEEHPDSLRYNMTYQDGRMLYAVATECGSLACPPYNSSLSLSCAVCSI